MIDDLRKALDRLRSKHVDELRRLVEIPTVSAQRLNLAEGAAAVVELLEARGLKTDVHETGYAPIVTAVGGASDGPTLLFYEHYDVQPPEPVEEWTVPPFELTERDGRLYGRGAADTKGNLICRLAAVDAVREVLGRDPVGYKFVVEGEEEVGSLNLPAFLEQHAHDLRADGCVWESGGVDVSGRPQVYAGMKGVVSFELRCVVADQDLHSSLGAVVDNPLWRLAAAIASMRDADGNVMIDGFFEDVEPLTSADEHALAAVPDNSAEIARLYGISRFLADAEGLEFSRRMQLTPCVNVNGIHGGYGGQGNKTVLPRAATAKLDIRLVERQRPDRVLELVRTHLDCRGFSDVQLEGFVGEAAGRTPLGDPFVTLVARTAEMAYGKPVVVQPSVGGSGPVHAFREHLGVPFASAGCNAPGNRVHAPDEHIVLEHFDAARLHCALIVAGMGGKL